MRRVHPTGRRLSEDRRAGFSMLLNAHWHRLRGSRANAHRCPACGAVVALDEAVRDGGERYHADCAPNPRVGA